jgi:hypothetical protein
MSAEELAFTSAEVLAILNGTPFPEKSRFTWNDDGQVGEETMSPDERACMKHLNGDSCIKRGPHDTHVDQYGRQWRDS